jgi:hypothetical protein
MFQGVSETPPRFCCLQSNDLDALSKCSIQSMQVGGLPLLIDYDLLEIKGYNLNTTNILQGLCVEPDPPSRFAGRWRTGALHCRPPAPAHCSVRPPVRHPVRHGLSDGGSLREGGSSLSQVPGHRARRNQPQSRPIVPNRAQSCPIAPNRAQSRPIVPNRAQSCPIAPNRAQPCPFGPNRAQSRPIKVNQTKSAQSARPPAILCPNNSSLRQIAAKAAVSARAKYA